MRVRIPMKTKLFITRVTSEILCPSAHTRFRIPSILAVVLFAFFVTEIVRGHCDGLDGPVVKAAQQALANGNVDLVLMWVQENDEAEVRQAFDHTRTVRKLNAAARDLSDRYFFETLVRLHRVGEGASYTGLKPAGRDLGPAIPASDKALETGDVEPLVQLLKTAMEEGVRRHFTDAATAMKRSRRDVDAGRPFVKAYVEYIHFIEGLYQAAANPVHGHFDDPSTPPFHLEERLAQK
jgi:hypothetical protein